uniref:Hemagglutinin-neuraminidase n=1 Tax=Human respirovirus 3 TaxID=11216 RepID=A0A023PHR9_9MONO|nr:hemagglutinin-neuraminidase [Human respirovirus 3]AHX22382.1 hemagglutinin-neuraminidase [Human respirovirus 3]AHX22486.1 hemagglutinin-neuraminidase [Human respirovirus 3]
MEYWKHTNHGKDVGNELETSTATHGNKLTNKITYILWTITLVLLSIIFIIVLTNSIKSEKARESLLQDINNEFMEVTEKIQVASDNTNDLIQSGVNTRLLTIQSHVQNYIPISLTQQISDLRKFISEITIRNDNQEVPPQRITHDVGIKPLNPDDFWRCTSGLPSLMKTPKIRLMPGPGLLAMPTTVDGCVRTPSLVINDLIYAYTSNLITRGCQDIGKSYQVLQIGIITVNSDLVPDLNPRISHTFNINDNRKSCSLALLNTDVYQLCSTPKVDERSDYASSGIEDIVLDIVNYDGSISTTRFKNNNISFDQPYAALYPSVGPGIYYKGKIIFLGYGGLEHPINENAICNTTGCPGKTQRDCNQASHSPWFSDRRMVNSIIVVDKGLNSVPKLKVWTISMRQNYWGSEGRLLLLGNKIYIYTRSTSWHSKLQLGIIDITDYSDIRIKWTWHNVLSRPGNNECPWGHSCPDGCITGVYTDAYPLNPTGSIVSSVILDSQKSRVNPVITYSTATERVNELAIRNKTLSAGYTTTSCITHYNKGYCFHIVEINHKSLNTFQPMLFKTEIPKSCS